MTEPRLVMIPEWEEFSWLYHGFSTRHGGVSDIYGGRSLNLGWTKEDEPAAVRENRSLLLQAVTGKSLSSVKLVTVRQIHSDTIHRVAYRDAHAGVLETAEGKAVLEGDGLITNEPGMLLAAGTADCVPVLLVDAEHRAVGAFHAGWRGTAVRIVEQGARRMQMEFGTRPENLFAAIGPSIGVCCYTVGQEVRGQFQEQFAYSDELFRPLAPEDGRSKFRIDLWKANRRQLLDAGVDAARITTVGECTACTTEASGEQRYFSHRAQAGRTGRMLNVIGIR
ncbi:MAG TPA: peptidoglycan editing factor PgeF [Edaphobacter sp.]|nr:peptidoglycan editing factor PgeF [Edaphobacter sp.]